MTPVVPLGFSALIPPAALFVIDVAVRNELTAFLRSTRQSIPESPPRGADPEFLSHILVGSPSERSSDALYAAASFAGLSREVSAVPGVDDSCGFETAFHQWRVFGLISDQTHNDLLDASRFVGKITVGNVVALHDMVGITYTHVFVPCWPSPARCQEPIYFRAMLRAGDPGVTLSLDTRHDPPDSAGCRQTAWISLKLSIARYMQSDSARRGSYEDRTSEAEVHLLNGHMDPVVPLGRAALLSDVQWRIEMAEEIRLTRQSTPMRAAPAVVSFTEVAGVAELERAGVSLIAASRLWSARLQPISDIIDASTSSDTRHSDLVWYLNPRGITEVTVVPRMEFWPLFSGDLGAMVAREPPRTADSHYWQLVDYFSSPSFSTRLVNLVKSRVGEDGLAGLVLAGVQLGLATPSTGRGLHIDKAAIARVLLTFTVAGDGCIRIEGEGS